MALQSHPMNLPSEEHKATLPGMFPTYSEVLSKIPLVAHSNDGDSMVADTIFGPPPTVLAKVCTQHHGSLMVLANPFTGDEQFVGPTLSGYPTLFGYVEQEKCSGSVRSRYPRTGTVLTGAPPGPAELAGLGIGQEIGPEGMASDLEPEVASSFPDVASFGSKVPSSQPTKRSARAEIPKKKFFIFRSPFLRCNFPHPERDVKLSFSHLVMQRVKCSYLR